MTENTAKKLKRFLRGETRSVWMGGAMISLGKPLRPLKTQVRRVRVGA